ncbi:hypothetical protein A4A49_59183 [Nicotiana attenuata]|uniref:Uncharacterized protein n=1 Tax=Nicotiana attenuata TaxID=49451 RepID=A0A1J6JRT5_NICAT|nr:hypothetical protein A4A49_59183 [Nicotiana attenuata]
MVTSINGMDMGMEFMLLIWSMVLRLMTEVEKEDALSDIVVGIYEDVANLVELTEIRVDPMGMNDAPKEINGNGAAQVLTYSSHGYPIAILANGDNIKHISSKHLLTQSKLHDWKYDKNFSKALSKFQKLHKWNYDILHNVEVEEEDALRDIALCSNNYTDVADGDINRWNGLGNGFPPADAVHDFKVDDSILHDVEVEEEDALSDIAIGIYEDVANLEELYEIVVDPMGMNDALMEINGNGTALAGYIDVTPFANSVQLRGYIIMIVTNADPDAIFEHYTDVADSDVNRWNGHENGAPAADAVHGAEVDDGILHDVEVEEEDSLSDIVEGIYEDVANLEELADIGEDPMGINDAPMEVNGNGAAQVQ